MNIRIFISIIFSLIIIFTSLYCGSNAQNNNDNGKKMNIEKPTNNETKKDNSDDSNLLNHPARDINNYDFPPKGDLLSKVKTPNEIIMDYFIKMDNKKGEYKSYTLTDKESDIVKQCFASLPKNINDVVSSRLLGIYFIENFLGSGFADFVNDKEGNMYNIMVLNPVLLKDTATKRLTYRESSCFIPENGYELTYNLGDDLALYFIFYHEIMHIYDYIKKVTPGEPMQDKKVYPEKFEFTKGIWTSFKTPTKEYDFPNRANLAFYGIDGGPKIKISDAINVYKDLEKSPFCSIYGAMTYMEDFAEYSAIYIYTKILKKNYKIEIKKDGKTIYSLENPLDKPKFTNRIEQIKNILSNSDN